MGVYPTEKRATCLAGAGGSCAPFPSASTYGCTGGEAWSKQTATTETACQNQCRSLASTKALCCYFKPGTGCYIKVGAAVEDTEGTGRASSCTPGPPAGNWQPTLAVGTGGACGWQILSHCVAAHTALTVRNPNTARTRFSSWMPPSVGMCIPRARGRVNRCSKGRLLWRGERHMVCTDASTPFRSGIDSLRTRPQQ